LRNWQKDWELCEKATPGPWDTHDGDIFDDGLRVFEESDGGTVASQLYEEDAQFIAEAREALPYWLTKYRELEKESAAIREAVKYLLPYLQRDFPWCENQCRAFRVEQQALSSTAGKALLDRLAKAEAVVEAAKDTCEELWGHGLIAIEALQKALDDLEGVSE